MASRDIKDCCPELQEKYLDFFNKMEFAGITFALTSTSRNIVEQMALFVQGRLDFLDVNRFRWIANLPMLKDPGENKIVTWTLKSEHVTNLFDPDLNNDCSRAFDIAILKEGKITWDLKVSVNKNEIPDYEEAGVIGEQCGLVWGGRWKKPDYPHFQLA